jgi:hypothetical protein
MSLEDRARSMARQGHAFATAEEVRVVYVREENEDRPLKDVPRDGKTLGEIVTRGNIVMKEVSEVLTYLWCLIMFSSISVILKRQRRRFVVVVLEVGI